MGLDDREYMRDVPIYRRLIGRSEGASGGQPLRPRLTSRDYLPGRRRSQARARSSSHVLQWVLVVGGAAAAFVFLVHRAEHNHSATSGPSVPAFPAPPVVEHPTQPAHRVALIRGSRLLQYGGRFTLSGTTAPEGGSMRILGRWNSGVWQTFAVANADGSRFSFSFPVNHHGTLHIKVVQPNGDTAVGTYHAS